MSAFVLGSSFVGASKSFAAQKATDVCPQKGFVVKAEEATPVPIKFVGKVQGWDDKVVRVSARSFLLLDCWFCVP